MIASFLRLPMLCSLLLLAPGPELLRAQEDPLHRTKSKASATPGTTLEGTTPSSPTATPQSTPVSGSGGVSPAPQGAPPALTEVLFKNLKARAIGPAVMGERVSEIALDPRNPFVFYVGLAHGGVFKTGDNGVSFDPIFDKQPTLSIGAIAVAPSDSDVIWVGSGEANDRLHSIRTNRFSFRSRRSKNLSRELFPPTAWDFLSILAV